ncbi:archaeal proteasome endopeptidase complex subunit alpha [Methanobacterium ferruginis]|jgi:proteasome alpha subunit|uniref:archaeal proteasome endopeptidase complex subunit alpha n=1 Tax=Methanobacterium ferruginis TaxID=710191 RepID=UPI002573DE10|nr:archaeal proteasome endopeptidase complex subunit alpha [Methanobacterium ferruginis]MCC7550040.1 archaeal proteasome endopeptidase complex subunit alpha [Methanobacterium sp.]BDZ68022.1 proteasome endopeptidase complex,subunit alpha [Methanobacterium ferruginis]
MQPFPAAGYDKGISIFSPDGRLFQVEYAREAVKRGTTSLGVKSSEGIVLVVDKRPSSKLVEPTSIEKIFQIDEHIGAATSGLVADARKLIEQARMESQVNKITFNEPIPVEMLAKKICDMKQMYTQHGGVRPFGSALIIGGVNDSGCRLFETDPSGALIEYKATAIGAGRALAMEVFEKSYNEEMKLEEAMELALDAIYEATEGKTTKESVEIAVIEKSTGKYRKLTNDEIDDHVEELLIRKSKEGEEEEE